MDRTFTQIYIHYNSNSISPYTFIAFLFLFQVFFYIAYIYKTEI